LGHHMKKFVLASLALVALAAPAFAADMPVKAVRAPLDPGFSWTGCYIGVNLGGAWNRQTVATDAAVAAAQNQAAVSADQNASSLIGGGQLGCNYQIDPRWVVGVEGDWSATHLSASATAPNLLASGAPGGPGGLAFTNDTKWLASLRARAGFLVMPNTLLFLTGGAAWAKTDYTGIDIFNVCPNCGLVSFSNTRMGYAVGGGAEYALTAHWLLRGEYLYYHINGASSTAFFQSSPATPAALFNWNALQVHELRAAVSYKF
jgi:outer membrane immunogenic protein